jgi:hypothetical protein
MRTHQEASEKKSSAQNTFVPTPNPLASRPFAVQPKPEESERSHSTKKYESAMPEFAILNPEGGRAMPVPPKLAIGAPGDKYEQEGNHMTKQVVQQINAPQSPQLQQQPTHKCIQANRNGEPKLMAQYPLIQMAREGEEKNTVYVTIGEIESTLAGSKFTYKNKKYTIQGAFRQQDYEDKNSEFFLRLPR